MRRVAFYGVAMAVLPVALLLVSSTEVSGESSAPKPEWSTGDFWEYEDSIVLINATITFRDRIEVVGVEDVTVRGRPYNVYNVTEVGVTSGPTGNITFVLTHWYRTSDLAVVQTSLDWSFFIRFEPLVEKRWPITAGMSWNGSTIQTNFAPGVGTVAFQVSYTTSVQAGGVLTTPAGRFETFLVRDQFVSNQSISTEESYYSILVGNSIRRPGPGDPDYLPLTLYRYQNAPRTSSDIEVRLFVGIGVVTIGAAVSVILILRKVNRAPRDTGAETPGQPEALAEPPSTRGRVP